MPPECDTLSLHSLASTITIASSTNSSASSTPSLTSTSSGGAAGYGIPGSVSLTADRRKAARARLRGALAATKPWKPTEDVGVVVANKGPAGQQGVGGAFFGRAHGGLRDDEKERSKTEGGGGGDTDEGGEQKAELDEETVEMRTRQLGRLNMITAASGWDIKLRELVMKEANLGDPQSEIKPRRNLHNRRSSPALVAPHTRKSIFSAHGQPAHPSAIRSNMLLSPQPQDMPVPSYFDESATVHRRANQFNSIVKGYDERLREIVMEAAKTTLNEGAAARTKCLKRSNSWRARMKGAYMLDETRDDRDGESIVLRYDVLLSFGL
ncbi:hypothetical protein HK104_000190 [Borealophlyctis nickersoniae]|nr:hypothetical protein HK104_000190 [Borealophlyctis nickersoniae]